MRCCFELKNKPSADLALRTKHFLVHNCSPGKYSDLSRSWSGNFTTCTVQTSVTLPIDNWCFGRALVTAYVCCLRNEFVKWKIFVTLRHRQTQVQDLINQHANPPSSMNIAFNRRAVSSALWLQITLVCCYLPHGIMSALLRHSEESTAASFNRHYTGTLVFANSTLNPFIYCLTIREVNRPVGGEGCNGYVRTLPRAAKVFLLASGITKKVKSR